jgi:hypothetical protein
MIQTLENEEGENEPRVKQTFCIYLMLLWSLISAQNKFDLKQKLVNLNFKS